MNSHIFKKYALIAAGSLALILGIVGLFFPVLPTTPFLLLASFCYLRSSKRLYNWLINHRLFGSYIYNYTKHRAIKKSVRRNAIIFLWATLIISMILVGNIYLIVLLFVIGCGVSIYLSTLKTY
ncbi:MAG: DUF454 domain-containing protein [Peptococcaceae bacterium]|jgi:uncharacterized membrane protein YbaN (DUF454 family)|nr:DUF454 domain-containing protein [Peptococcaceae bacterium]